MLQFRAHTPRRTVPHEPLAVRRSRDQDHSLSATSTTKHIDKRKGLDTLTLGVSLKRADNLALGQRHQLNLAGR